MVHLQMAETFVEAVGVELHKLTATPTQRRVASTWDAEQKYQRQRPQPR